MLFPQLQKIALQSFSLYRNRPDLLLRVDIPLFCLAGANGLGKSTFLSTVTYGLTGVIPNPRDTYDSIEEHYRHNLTYSAEYFSGRIEEHDRESAEISLDFALGENRYSITRGLFDHEALRRLEISTVSGESRIAGLKDSDGARNDAYKGCLVADTGLGTFEQYVFLQHFVFTFDERRRLLFWEPEVVEQALYLAFGISGEKAQMADTWRRQAARAESQARNLQYQATTARNRLNELAELTDLAQDADGTDPVLQYERLLEDRQLATDALRRATTAHEDAFLQFQRAKAEELSVRNEYEEQFNAHFRLLSAPHEHPVVQQSIEAARCAVCGTEGEEVVRRIAGALDEGRCPLCGSDLTDLSKAQEKVLKKAKALANRLAKCEETTRNRGDAVSRLAADVQELQEAAEAAAGQVTEFEAESADLPVLLPSAGLSEAQARLTAEIEDATRRRDRFRARRNALRSQLREVQKQLQLNYREAEAEFLPRFTSLAQGFLGLDLQLQLDVRENTKLGLTLEVEGSRRREIDQLSESQRYFIDIALRMAIAQHMVGEEATATLFIDTPEGSLDVAYESRAGSMFSEFVQQGQRIIMTANLNASQLLREMARESGRERMRVTRMIDWAVLSEVQIEAEGLFDQAYEEIERSLERADDQE